MVRLESLSLSLVLVSLGLAGCSENGLWHYGGRKDMVPTDFVPNPESPDDGLDDVGGDEDYEHVGVLLIEADGPILDGDKTDAWMEVVRDHDGTLTDLDDAPRAWEGDIGIELHGYSTVGEPKENYRIEMRDEEGEDIDFPLLGLGSDSDYVLHASYGDKTYVRNALAYRVASKMGESTGEWQPETAYAEVYLNGDYIGLYVVTERVKRDDSRVNLPNPANEYLEGDITGGYIFKIDGGRGPYFTTAAGTMVELVDPRDSQITTEQYAYVTSWYDDFESAMLSDDFDDENRGYPGWIDVDSWVDYVLVNELTHNVGAYRTSAYHYKDAFADGGLLHMGPVWDFDQAFGNADFCAAYDTGGWALDDIEACGYGDQVPVWWSRMLEDKDFGDRLRCRWDELRQGLLTDEALEKTIDAYADQLTEAQPRDQDRWHTIGMDVGYNHYVGDTYADEVQYLKTWVKARAAWMDGALWGTCG